MFPIEGIDTEDTGEIEWEIIAGKCYMVHYIYASYVNVKSTPLSGQKIVHGTGLI
jgi:hypothetical protein